MKLKESLAKPKDTIDRDECDSTKLHDGNSQKKSDEFSLNKSKVFSKSPTNESRNDNAQTFGDYK